MPPASTTPAFFRTGFCSTVSASAPVAPSMATVRTVSEARLVDLDGLLGGNARDGQDRALGGLHHGLIRGLDAGLKRGGELTAVAFLQPL